MAKSKLVTYFKTTLEDKPGTLLAVVREMKSKKIGLVALWGYGTQPGQGELYCIPKNPDKYRNAYRSFAPSAEEGSGIFVKGSDKTGALVKTLEAITKEGINITAVHAVAAGGNYGSFIRVAQEDMAKTAKILGAK